VSDITDKLTQLHWQLRASCHPVGAVCMEASAEIIALRQRVQALADGLDAAVAWIDAHTTVEQHNAWKRSPNCGAAEKARHD
jgi:hypothetical protein